MNERFGLEHQRPFEAADVQVSDEEGADFAGSSMARSCR